MTYNVWQWWLDKVGKLVVGGRNEKGKERKVGAQIHVAITCLGLDALLVARIGRRYLDLTRSRQQGQKLHLKRPTHSQLTLESGRWLCRFDHHPL